MRSAGTVALEEDVEQFIVWLFSTIGGGVAVELPEEVIVRALRGRFPASRIFEGLSRLKSRGAAVSVDRHIDGVSRKCWRVSADSWRRMVMTVPGQGSDEW